MSLRPGVVVDAASLALPLDDVAGEQAVAGEPRAGYVELASVGGVEVGVWEHTPGSSTDVEADEVFVVLSGSATVTFEGTELEPIELFPGAVVQLAAGMRTVWDVRETLRKVYIAG